MTYRVTWTIDIDSADEVISAAIQAFVYMQRHGTTANVFDVQDSNGHTTRVDLQETLANDPKSGALLDKLGRERAPCYLLKVGDLSILRPADVSGPFEQLDDARHEANLMQTSSSRYPLHLMAIAVTPRELVVE